MRKAADYIGGTIHFLWYWGWRTALFLGGIVGFFWLISIVDGAI